jgi:mycothiol synthase
MPRAAAGGVTAKPRQSADNPLPAGQHAAHTAPVNHDVTAAAFPGPHPPPGTPPPAAPPAPARAFIWRPIDAGHLRAWADLRQAVEEADRTGEHFTEADLLALVSGPAVDAERGTIGVYDGGLIVADGVLMSQSSADPVHQMRFYADVHPAYRGLGIGSALLAWAEQAAPPLHAERFGGRPLALRTRCGSTNAAALELFAARGYRPSRWFHAMICDLRAYGRGEQAANVPIPAGFRVLPFDADRAADSLLVKNEAFRDHWGASETSAEMWAHGIAEPSFRPSYSFLAYQREEPLAVIMCHEYAAHTEATGERDLYVDTVATRRAGRKRGIASSLIRMALAAARADGFDTASLGVDAGSLTGAVGLYERLGFTVRQTLVVHLKTLLT